ncbi:hypothetical protein HanRHA438_Chr15g0691821 [Helianthus annuus]|nr:hypothetical protein HanRHA438_Chr15g0691821 [Helianthus annuus]
MFNTGDTFSGDFEIIAAERLIRVQNLQSDCPRPPSGYNPPLPEPALTFSLLHSRRCTCRLVWSSFFFWCGLCAIVGIR